MRKTEPSKVINSRNLSLISLFVLLLFAVVSPGQEPEEKPVPSSLNLHQWGSLTLFHGLPSNHVRAIAQDADGILWFGTDSGLAKYDGRRIQKVIAIGLPSGRIRALKLDADGALWVGTDSGAASYSNGQFRSIAETDGKAITAISTSTRGRTVLVSEQGVIFVCTSQTNAPFKIRTIGPNENSLLKLETNSVTNPLPLTGLVETKDTLIVGTRGRGMLAITGNEVKELASRPRPFFVNATAMDANGHLWFGADSSKGDSGLYKSEDLLRPQKIDLQTGVVKTLAFDQQNALWAGTDGQGAFRFSDGRPLDHFTFENTAGGLRSNLVLSIFVDRESVIWFGTDRGVCRYDPHSPHIDPVSDIAGSNFVRALYRARDGRQWCGTNRGLFTRDNGAIGWRPIEDLTGKTVHSINEDQTGNILVGTAGGVYRGANDLFSLPGWYRFNKLEKSADGQLSSESVRSICYFRDGIYLASYGNGVERLDGDERKQIWPTDASDPHQRNVVSLFSEGNDKLWIGTAEAGVFLFDGNRITAEPGLAELRNGSVWSIAGNSKDGLWFATSRGLFRYVGGKLQQILQNGDARQVVTDNDPKSVWCATTGNGLYKVVFDDTAGAIVSRLDTEHGLPSDSVFAILPVNQTKDETTLWLGTNRGVAYYEPGTIPPIVRAVRVLGKRVYQPEELPAGLHLEYPQNSLVTEIAASSSRTFPEHFQYSFVLLNDAGKIIKTNLSTDSQFQMEGLKPGGYRVVARAYTNDLVVSQPLEFHFEVAKAPFPLTSTALAFLLALALVTLWWGYRQNRKIADTNVALAGANQQLADTRMQLANETENERRRISRDLHDQTLSDLRRLMLLTDQLPKEKIGSGQTLIDPAVFRTEIESISTEIRHICEDLSPSVLANVGLAAALEWALSNTVAHLPSDHKFEYEFSCVDDLEEKFVLDSGQQIQIYRIVQEAISNVGHHASAHHVKLNVEIADDHALLINLEDDGRGFDPANALNGTGRGLNNIRSRASLVDAEANWIRKPEGGIVFTLRKSPAQ